MWRFGLGEIRQQSIAASLPRPDYKKKHYVSPMLDSIEINQRGVRTSWDHSCTEPPCNGYMVQINGCQFTMTKRLSHCREIPIIPKPQDEHQSEHWIKTIDVLHETQISIDIYIHI